MDALSKACAERSVGTASARSSQTLFGAAPAVGAYSLPEQNQSAQARRELSQPCRPRSDRLRKKNSENVRSVSCGRWLEGFELSMPIPNGQIFSSAKPKGFTPH